MDPVTLANLNCITEERLPTHVLASEPGHGGTRHGNPADGSACKGGRRGLGPEATQASPRSSRPIGGGCCRADCHSLRRWVPASRPAVPLHTETSTKRGQTPFSKG